MLEQPTQGDRRGGDPHLQSGGVEPSALPLHERAHAARGSRGAWRSRLPRPAVPGGSQPPPRIGHTGSGGAVRSRMTALVRARACPTAQRVIRFRIDVVIDAEMRRGPPQQRGRHEVQLDHRDIVRTAWPKGLPSGASERHDWPMEDHAVPSNTGREALAAGDWPGARSSFESILTETDDPEAHLGLGRALWWMQDIDGALFHMEAAYAGVPVARRSSRGRGGRAVALAGVRGGARQRAGELRMGGQSRGAPARTKVRCVEQGWLALTPRRACGDPGRIATAAREALDIARELRRCGPGGGGAREGRVRRGRRRRRRLRDRRSSTRRWPRHRR